MPPLDGVARRMGGAFAGQQRLDVFMQACLRKRMRHDRSRKHEEQQQKEGEVSQYFTEARLMQKICSDHFIHAGVLSIVGQER